MLRLVRGAIKEDRVMLAEFSLTSILLIALFVLAIIGLGVGIWLLLHPPAKRRCPYCGARIPKDAIRCAVCDRDIPPEG
jgi:hypothetical protein